MNKNSSFGPPKPLAGQVGYNLNEVDLLELESKEMEKRLLLLKDRIQRDEVEREKFKGGSKWKSARKDKGSLLSYSKDVQEKRNKSNNEIGYDPILKALEEQAALAQAEALAMMNKDTKGKKMANNSFISKHKQPNIKPDIEYEKVNKEKAFSSKINPVTVWSCEEVSKWLVSIGLDQYSSVFYENQINGEVLLDISLEDLDYMSITALGHRKLILKAVESLKITSNIPKLPIISPRLEVDGNTLKSSSSAATAAAAAASSKKHWSHLEPLSSNKVKNSNEISINSADYMKSTEELDEIAEREAFTRAVMEWRNSNKTIQPANEPITIEENPKIFQKEVENESLADTNWHNPFSGPTASSHDHDISFINEEIQPLSARGLKSLADGELDEAKEHEEFAKAVEAWRQGQTSSTTRAASAKLKNIANIYIESLDKEFKASSEMLEKQQKAAREMLEAMTQSALSSKLSDEIDDSLKSCDEEEYLPSSGIHMTSKELESNLSDKSFFGEVSSFEPEAVASDYPKHLVKEDVQIMIESFDDSLALEEVSSSPQYFVDEAEDEDEDEEDNDD